ncbi:MAG: NIPSNAP family protein [Balneolaceae bacterium]
MKYLSKLLIPLSVAVMVVAISSCSGADGAGQSATESADGVYEMRTYTTYDGKLDDLHRRFEDHTMDFFEKHGMTNVAYWSPQNEELRENTLIYILKHASREAAETSWQNFRDDEGWQQVYEASREDGPIVQGIESVYMTETPYSPEF